MSQQIDVKEELAVLSVRIDWTFAPFVRSNAKRKHSPAKIRESERRHFLNTGGSSFGRILVQRPLASERSSSFFARFFHQDRKQCGDHTHVGEDERTKNRIIISQVIT